MSPYSFSKDNRCNEKVKRPGEFEGLILIADISGYSRFVHNTELFTGKHIIHELLSSVVDHNELGLKLSEIEGDAALFYRPGPPPSTTEILGQYETMLSAFHKKVEYLKTAYQSVKDLTLKMIAHYGQFTEFRIAGFTKLYGESVIEVHRLLKNSIDSHSYVLMTDKLVDAVESFTEASSTIMRPLKKQLCESYDQQDSICYSYFDFTPNRTELRSA
jgi:hypothetical protein